MYEREKKIDCGPYREIDIIPRSEAADDAVRKRRRKRLRVTSPKQQGLNDKNAKRYLLQLLNGNFGAEDLHVSLTYDGESLPETVEQAEETVRNYLRRVAYRRKKLGLPPLKYILITERGSRSGRIHHHVVMNGGIPRDEVEMMWTARRINWRKVGTPGYRIEQLGYVNADRLRPTEAGLEELSKYLTKDPKGKKRWSSSRNLERPMELPPADHKYTRRRVIQLATLPPEEREAWFRRQFPAFRIIDTRAEYYEETGWHIYVRAWKKGVG